MGSRLRGNDGKMSAGVRRLAALLVFATLPAASAAAAASPAVTQSALDGLEGSDWTVFYERAAVLQANGDTDAAALAFYAGQYRGRVFVQCLKPPEDGAPALLASANATLGAGINRAVGQSVKRWLAAIDGALAWTQANPDPATAGAKCAAVRASQRAGMKSLRDDIAADPAAIRAERAANGLPNDAD